MKLFAGLLKSTNDLLPRLATAGLMLILVVILFLAKKFNSYSLISTRGFTESMSRTNSLESQKIVTCSPGSNSSNNYYDGETIEPNDNRHPAGQLKEGILTIHLEAREGI